MQNIEGHVRRCE